ncbi:MAG TPA: FAD-dependent oxidoreductase, partial [Stellaceae bacterium]
MAKYDFDMFTIGAGSGGVASSRRAGSYGARIAIAEDSRVGGTCVIRGCVPKKLLVYGAQFAEAFADASAYGWTVAPPAHDWASLIAAKDKEIGRLEGIYHRLLKDSGVALIEGRAKLIDPHTVEVDGKHYTAANVLVATGAHPVLPAIPGIEHAITSNEALDLPTLPRRIVIVGGSYIAVEFAGIFQGLGAEVTLVIRGEDLLRGFDDDLRVALAQELRRRGIDIRARTQITRIDKMDHGYDVTTAQGDVLSADLVMYATGRRPNTRGLGLDAAGVRLNEAGAVIVDEWSRSMVPHIYAVGDVTDRLNLTPVAIAEGRALAETLFNDNPIKMDHADVPTAVFSQPPIGTVGLTER